MKGVRLSEALEHLQERQRNYYDFELSAKEVRMNDDGTMWLSSLIPAAHLQDQALNSLANRIGVQAGYLRRCSGELTDLRAENVNRWLQRIPNDKRFFVRMDGNECRAILSTSYKPLDNLEILDMVFDQYYHQEQWMRVNLELDATEMMAQIFWISDEYSVTARKSGDTSRLGVHIGNSEVGFHSVEFAAYIYRLVCTNGMVISEKISYRRTHLMDSSKLSGLISEALPEIIQSLPRIGNTYRRSMEIEVPNPIRELERLCERFKLTKEQQSLVFLNFQLNPDYTLFGIANAFTGAANEAKLSVESRRTLQKAGGEVLAGINVD